jgi:hypothetical protein
MNKKFFYTLAIFMTLGFVQSLSAQTGNNPCTSPITNCAACRGQITTFQTACTGSGELGPCGGCILSLANYCSDCARDPSEPEGICDDGEAGNDLRKAFCFTGKPVFGSALYELGTY